MTGLICGWVVKELDFNLSGLGVQSKSGERGPSTLGWLFLPAVAGASCPNRTAIEQTRVRRGEVDYRRAIRFGVFRVGGGRHVDSISDGWEAWAVGRANAPAWDPFPMRSMQGDGTTHCPGFPTVRDRINMAASAYAEYAESDGTSVIDFALDVLLFAQSQFDSDKTLLPRLARKATREWRVLARPTCSVRRVHSN